MLRYMYAIATEMQYNSLPEAYKTPYSLVKRGSEENEEAALFFQFEIDGDIPEIDCLYFEAFTAQQIGLGEHLNILQRAGWAVK